MKIRDIIDSMEVLAVKGSTDTEINGIVFDSRKCTPGSLFIAVNGVEADGHRFIGAALKNGASAVICEKDCQCEEGPDATFVKVKDSRTALAVAASNFFGHPSSKLHLVGITGTNGKTTTVTLLYNLFMGMGFRCGLISTIANYVGTEKREADHTTPDPVALNSLLSEMVRKGCEYCFMEVSSHAIDQQRICGLDFTAGIFSNLTHDHLDYHKTFEAYRDCKKRFFDTLPANAFAISNIDDRNGSIMLQNTSAHKVTYSCRTLADFNCKIVEESIDGMEVEIDGKRLWSRFIGVHNAYNLLAVYTTAVLLGADKEDVLVKMSALGPVSGRLECIRGGKELTAAVDYAHTPDALENVLKTLRSTCRDRHLVCVFGCGGNRDKTKRPEMGAIASKYADRVFVTSDNPRHERPEEIISDIKAGMDAGARAKSIFITDRKEAIRTSILTAPEGAVILVAGKGHEDYQIVGDVKSHFSDREIIEECFQEMRN